MSRPRCHRCRHRGALTRIVGGWQCVDLAACLRRLAGKAA